MATRKKTAKKNPKVLGRNEAAATNAPAPAPAGQNKSMVRVIIAIVVAVCVIEGFNLFHSDETPKTFKVQTLLNVSADNDACGHFNAWGVAPVGKDKVMVVDQEDNRVLVFDHQGNCLKSWGKSGVALKGFHEPSGLTSDDKGNGYVIDTWNSYIKGFDAEGKPVLSLNLSDKNLFGPRGIAFDGQNFVLADTGSHRIAFISLEGKVVGSWGGNGSAEGQFKGPLGVACDGKGNYLVADTENHRVQWLDKDGKVVKVFKVKGNPPSIALDGEGRFFVSAADNAGNGCVRVYSLKSGYLGDLRDEKDAVIPGGHGMNVTKDNILMIAEGGRVSLYQLPHAAP
jgi:hypothetical protein